MAKEYTIESKEDFLKMSNSFFKYFRKREIDGKPFYKIKIIAKRYVKSKTPKQHRLYWAYIGELKNAFEDAGYRYNQEEIHEFIKKEHGFTKIMELPNGKASMVTKSIADTSEDVNGKSISSLIEFIKEWSITNLNYEIVTKGE